MFEAGQNVRCVNRKGWTYLEGGAATGPKFGAVCVVAGLYAGAHPLTGGAMMFLDLREWPGEQCFEADAFVPLEDAEFERLREACLPAPVQARELAAVES